MKSITDKACDQLDGLVEKVFTHMRTNTSVPMVPGRDLVLRDEMDKMRPVCPAETMDAEDPLFLLYTSGEKLPCECAVVWLCLLSTAATTSQQASHSLRCSQKRLLEAQAWVLILFVVVQGLRATQREWNTPVEDTSLMPH